MHKKDGYAKDRKSYEKVDKLKHQQCDMGTMAKKSALPGQQYVPKKTHNESDFAGEMY
jgi:hypothetical protein